MEDGVQLESVLDTMSRAQLTSVHHDGSLDPSPVLGILIQFLHIGRCLIKGWLDSWKDKILPEDLFQRHIESCGGGDDNAVGCLVREGASGGFGMWSLQRG